MKRILTLLFAAVAMTLGIAAQGWDDEALFHSVAEVKGIWEDDGVAGSDGGEYMPMGCLAA